MRLSHLAAVVAAPIVLALPAPAWARDDQQIWTTGVVNVKLSDSWRLQEEVVGRFSDNRNGLYEIEANTLLGYRLNKKVTLWAGYTHDPQYSEGDFTAMERRLREQVTFDNVAQLGPGKLSFRVRTEQRWRSNADGTGWRLRPYVKYSVPFRKGAKTSLTLSSEFFVDLNTTPFQKQAGVERMRNLIAVNTPLTKNLNAEIGYLNQYGFVRHGDDTIDHVASVSLIVSL
jgi:hypothetical protein